MPEHRDLTGAQLHEPKGAATATAGNVYVADGAGSGSWTSLAASKVSLLDTAGNFTATHVEDALIEAYEAIEIINAILPDVSTSSTVLIPIPISSTVVNILFTLAGAITVADATVTVTRSDGAAMGTQVIAYSGSAEGTSFDFTPSGNDVLTSPTHKYIKIVTDGASTTAMALYISVSIKRE